MNQFNRLFLFFYFLSLNYLTSSPMSSAQTTMPQSIRASTGVLFMNVSGLYPRLGAAWQEPPIPLHLDSSIPGPVWGSPVIKTATNSNYCATETPDGAPCVMQQHTAEEYCRRELGAELPNIAQWAQLGIFMGARGARESEQGMVPIIANHPHSPDTVAFYYKTTSAYNYSLPGTATDDGRDFYWSSTVPQNNPSNAYDFNAYTGQIHTFERTRFLAVRCVVVNRR